MFEKHGFNWVAKGKSVNTSIYYEQSSHDENFTILGSMCPCSAYFESNWDDTQNYFLIQ
jgi:hypothetical protein